MKSYYPRIEETVNVDDVTYTMTKNEKSFLKGQWEGQKPQMFDKRRHEEQRNSQDITKVNKWNFPKACFSYNYFMENILVTENSFQKTSRMTTRLVASTEGVIYLMNELMGTPSVAN